MMPSYPLHADCGDAYVTCVECDAVGPSVLIDMDYHTEEDWPDLETEAVEGWNRRAELGEINETQKSAQGPEKRGP